MTYKRGQFYWYKFSFTITEDGERVTYAIRRSSKLSNRQKANAMQERHHDALAQGLLHPSDPWPPVPKPQSQRGSFAAVADEMIVSTELRRKPGTVRFYRQALDRVRKFGRLADCPVDRIDSSLIDAYSDWRLAKSDDSRVTVDGELRTIRRVLNFAARKGYLLKPPAVQMVGTGEGRQRVLSFEEEAKYLAAASPTLRDIAILMLDCGLRPESECFGLRWTQITDQGVTVDSGKTRNARRVVPISKRVKAVLELRKSRNSGSPFVFPAESASGHLTSVTKAHYRACDGAGIERFAIYCLRHTFASRAAQAGVDRWTLSKWLGHSSPATSDRFYIHVTSQHQAEGFERFESYVREHQIEAVPSVTERVQ